MRKLVSKLKVKNMVSCFTYRQFFPSVLVTVTQMSKAWNKARVLLFVSAATSFYFILFHFVFTSFHMI